MTSPYLVSTQRGSLSNTDDPTFTAGHMAVGEFSSGPRGIGTLASAHGLVSSASPSMTHPPPAPVAGAAAVRRPSTAGNHSSYLNHTPGSHHSQPGHQGHQHNPDHIENPALAHANPYARAPSGPRAPSVPYSEASVQRGHGGAAGHPSSAALGDVRGGSASIPRRHTNTSLSRERSNVAVGAGGDSVSALAMLSDIGPAAATYDIASGGEALQLSAEEVEARSKARAVLQQFQQQQHKSAQLQQKLDEANAENARLVRMLHDRKVEAASAVDHAGQSRRAAEDKIDEVRRELELAREESQTVAKACAERTADAASQLRLKEHEVRQLEAEVLAAREQARSAYESLRAAVGDETGAGPVVKLKQTEQQMVDIARKLLESEHRVKDLERQIVDGRAAVNDNATSIEGLRRQLVAAEKRADEAEAKRAQDLDSHMDAINAVKQEAEEDKKVLEHLLAAGGPAATPAADRPSGLNHTPGAGGSGAADAVQNRSISASDLKHTIAASGRGVETQVLKVQLDASKEIAVQLAQQLQDAHAESDRLRASLEEERSARAKLTETQREQCRRIEYELQVQQQQHRQAFAEREEAQRQIQLALSSVEGGKKDQQQLRDDIDRQHKAALAAAEKYAVAQAELEKLQSVKEENELLQGRTADLEATVAELEHRLKEEEQLHHQAARLARVRAETTDTLAADRCVPLAAPAYLKENDELRARALALESETKDALTSLQAVQTRAEEDRSAALMEHDRLTRELVAAKQTITDLQADVSGAAKKADEWKLAFVTAEKKRQHAQEEAEAAQVEAAHGANTNAKQQEHIALLSSHAARLEREVEELARQLSRVRATKPTSAATGPDGSVLLDASRNAAQAGSSVSAQPADVTPATPPRPMSGVDVDGRLSPGARAFSTALQDTLQSLDEHSRASSIAPVGYSAPPGVPQPNPTSSAGGSSSLQHQGQYYGGTRSISNNNGGSNGVNGYPRGYAGRDASQEPHSAAYGRASMGAVEAAVEADSASIPNRAPSPGSSPVPVTDSRRPRSAVEGEGVAGVSAAPQQAVPLPSSLLGKINGGQSSLPPLSALSHLTGPVTPPASLVLLPGEEGAATGGSPDSGVRTVLADIAKELYSPSP